MLFLRTRRIPKPPASQAPVLAAEEVLERMARGEIEHTREAANAAIPAAVERAFEAERVSQDCLAAISRAAQLPHQRLARERRQDRLICNGITALSLVAAGFVLALDAPWTAKLATIAVLACVCFVLWTPHLRGSGRSDP